MDKPKQIPLFNPLSEDFSYIYKDDMDVPHTYTMRALEISFFDPPVARFMAKHLSDAVYHKRGQKLNHDDDIQEILKEIEVI